MSTTRRSKLVGASVLTAALTLSFFAVKGQAADTIQPIGPVGTGITIVVPAGTNNAPGAGFSQGNPFKDDVYLSTITFAGGTLKAFSSGNVFIQEALVTAARHTLNAEFGDNDNGADGDPNPFVQAGATAEGINIWGTNHDVIRESTVPAIQDAAIAAALRTPNLLGLVDGEDGKINNVTENYTFRVMFERSISDNNWSVQDYLPEIVFWERGVNSDFSVRAILDGSKIDNPVYAPNTVTVFRTDLLASGIWIDTVEINRSDEPANPPQQLGFVGIDLTSFGAHAEIGWMPIIGLEISALNLSGPDLGLAIFDNGRSSLGDRVWHDLNGNGIQDPGEPGIAGITVNLLDGSGNPTGLSTITDVNGLYLFSDLTPGNYSVEFVKPAAYDLFSPQHVGGDSAVDSDADTLTGKTGATTLLSGQTDLTLDAGMLKYAVLGDYVWLDLNKNGIQDPGEPGVESVAVNLLDGFGALLASTLTDENGHYLFSELLPGLYELEFVLPPGYEFTTEGAGLDPEMDSNANAFGRTGQFWLLSGQSDLSWDAGLVLEQNVPEPASLGLVVGGVVALLARGRRRRE